MNKYQEALQMIENKSPCVENPCINCGMGHCYVKDARNILQELIDEHQRLLTERDRLAFELCEAKNNDANRMLEMIAKGTTQFYGK